VTQPGDVEVAGLDGDAQRPLAGVLLRRRGPHRTGELGACVEQLPDLLEVAGTHGAEEALHGHEGYEPSPRRLDLPGLRWPARPLACPACGQGRPA
jgi:hypothetical protein